MFNLEDQVALVTGGANGIGKGIVKMLAEAGAHVIIGDIDVAAGKQAAREVDGDFYEMDVTDKERLQRVVADIIEKNGRLDVLAANTGIFPQAELEDMTEEEWDTMNAVNLKSTFLSVQAVIPQMKKQGYGRIVLTSSITGPIVGYPGWSHYAATKAGQLGFMRSAALELAKDGITVNAVQPGNILSEGLKAQGEEYLKAMAKNIPTKKLGEPEDIGAAVTFLASKEAKFITGQTIVVDGGQVLPEEPEALL